MISWNFLSHDETHSWWIRLCDISLDRDVTVFCKITIEWHFQFMNERMNDWMNNKLIKLE